MNEDILKPFTKNKLIKLNYGTSLLWHEIDPIIIKGGDYKV